MTSELLKRLGHLLREVAQREIVPRFRQLAPSEVIGKPSADDPHDLVTAADRAAEAELTRLLPELVPGSSVVGEEAVALDPTVLERLRELTTSGVPFDAPDGAPVRLVFSMLVPEQATEQHLEILSELAQMFSDPAFREALMAAPDATAAHQLLVHWSPYGNASGTGGDGPGNQNDPANAPPVRSAAV